MEYNLFFEVNFIKMQNNLIQKNLVLFPFNDKGFII